MAYICLSDIFERIFNQYMIRKILLATGKILVLLVLPGGSFLLFLFLLSSIDFSPQTKLPETLTWIILFAPSLVVTYALYRLFKKDWGVWVIGLFSIMITSTLSLSCPGPFCSEKKPGLDAAIKTNLAQIRIRAELFLDAHGTYGTSDFPTGPCPIGVIPGADFFNTPDVSSALSEIKRHNGGITPTCALVVNGTSSQYAISPPLKSDRSKYWCIDSSSVVKEISRPISEARCP